MIDKQFWSSVAAEWKIMNDEPPLPIDPIQIIEPDDEIDVEDILAEFDI